MISKTYRIELKVRSKFGLMEFDMIPRDCIYDDGTYTLCKDFHSLEELHNWASKVPDQFIQNMEFHAACDMSDTREQVTNFLNSIKDRLNNIKDTNVFSGFDDELDESVWIKVKFGGYDSLYIMNDKICSYIKRHKISKECIEKWLWDKIKELENEE